MDSKYRLNKIGLLMLDIIKDYTQKCETNAKEAQKLKIFLFQTKKILRKRPFLVPISVEKGFVPIEQNQHAIITFETPEIFIYYTFKGIIRINEMKFFIEKESEKWEILFKMEGLKTMIDNETKKIQNFNQIKGALPKVSPNESIIVTKIKEENRLIEKPIELNSCNYTKTFPRKRTRLEFLFQKKFTETTLLSYFDQFFKIMNKFVQKSNHIDEQSKKQEEEEDGTTDDNDSDEDMLDSQTVRESMQMGEEEKETFLDAVLQKRENPIFGNKRIK